VNSYDMHLEPSELTLKLENIYENKLTHVHKVINLVVSTYEKGFKKWHSRGSVSTKKD